MGVAVLGTANRASEECRTRQAVKPAMVPGADDAALKDRDAGQAQSRPGVRFREQGYALSNITLAGADDYTNMFRGEGILRAPSSSAWPICFCTRQPGSIPLGSQEKT